MHAADSTTARSRSATGHTAWAPNVNATWDTHGSNFKSLRERLLPELAAACSNLITDLANRRMLDRTIIAITGDFDRTPKINGNNAGRDHSNYCYSLMLAGGGFAQGQIYGASDATGAFPAISSLIPRNIISTIYRCLGIRHDRLIYDQTNRPPAWCRAAISSPACWLEEFYPFLFPRTWLNSEKLPVLSGAQKCRGQIRFGSLAAVSAGCRCRPG